MLDDVSFKFGWRIQIKKVKDALAKKNKGKVVGPDCIPIDVWKCLGNTGLSGLLSFFN